VLQIGIKVGSAFSESVFRIGFWKKVRISQKTTDFQKFLPDSEHSNLRSRTGTVRANRDQKLVKNDPSLPRTVSR
jgi:hypothetical protein